MTIAMDAEPTYDVWTQAAICRTVDNPDIFYTEAFYNDAKMLCAICPVRTECLAEGLRQDSRGLHGIWGGLTPEERLKLRRNHA